MHRMNPNADAVRWRAWLQALADPGHRLEITTCGFWHCTTWDMGRRTLSEHMLHLIFEGGQIGSIAGVPVRSGPGDALWVPAGTEQVLRKRPEVPRLGKTNVRFRLAGAIPPPLPALLHRCAGAQVHLHHLRRELHLRGPGQEERLRAILVLLFAELWRAQTGSSVGLEPAEQERLLDLVDRDPTARPTPASLARSLGLEPPRFARLFQATYGCPARHWLIRHRIERAAERLVDGNLAIGSVAEEFGYPDLFLFSRQFRRVLGISPRQWRDQPAGGRR